MREDDEKIFMMPSLMATRVTLKLEEDKGRIKLLVYKIEEYLNLLKKMRNSSTHVYSIFNQEDEEDSFL